MSKAVIASLKPYFYYLVGEGIKKVEVRKSKPKADDWNRETYFYMSKDEKSFAKIPKEYQDKYRKHFGKVGLKFVCDRIDTFDYPYLKKPQPEDTMEDIVQFFRKSEKLSKACLSYDAIETYGKGKTLYGWHISDLKIYDKPKELSEFKKEIVKGALPIIIIRPPQSWFYCEELEK